MTNGKIVKKTKESTKKNTYQDIANYFLAISNDIGEPITNLRLQKLVYYAQAWYLANHSKPLFKEDFEAWVHGPVIPKLYQKYKKYGFSPIQENIILEEVEKKFNPEIIKFLDKVYKVYMQYNTYQLEMMTHRENPWIKARKNHAPDEKCSVVIPKNEMEKYYGKKIKD